MTGKTPSHIDKRDMYFYLPCRFEGGQMNGADFENGGISPSAAVINDNWKLIYFHKNQNFELYNLEDDLSETKSLFTSNPKIAQKLVEKLDSYLSANSAVRTISFPERVQVPWALEAFETKHVQ